MSYSASQLRDAAGKWTAGAIGAVAGAVTADRIRTATALLVKSALYHIVQLDDSALGPAEDQIESMIHNSAAHLQVGLGRAMEMQKAVVASMIAAKKASP